MSRFIQGVILAAFVLAAASCSNTDGRKTITDPQGRFQFNIGDELTPRLEQESFYQYRQTRPGVDVYVTAVPAVVEEKGVEDVLDRVGVDRARLVLDGSASFGDWRAIRWRQDGGDLNVALAYQARGGTVYALVVIGTQKEMPGDPPPAVMRVLGSVKFTPAAGKLSRPGTREELEREIQRAAETRSASISVAVIRDGTIVYRYASGVGRRDATAASGAGTPVAATPATAYHWGSMTKLVTATAVMKLVEQHKVTLDEPVERYLPEFPGRLGITVRHLLTHSSGLPDREADHLVSFAGHSLPPLPDVLSSYLGRVTATEFKPGTDAAYSNWNYLALGVLVERVSGTPYVDFVQSQVLRPLGMTHTAFRSADLPEGTPLATPVIPSASEPGLMEILQAGMTEKEATGLILGRSDKLSFLADVDILPPWGGLEGTAEDVARFLGMSMGKPPAGTAQVLAPATLASMRAPPRSAGRTLPWSLGWGLRQEQGEELMEHGGGGPGIECLMRIYPRRGLGVVIMGNVQNYGSARLLSAATDIFGNKG